MAQTHGFTDAEAGALNDFEGAHVLRPVRIDPLGLKAHPCLLERPIAGHAPILVGHQKLGFGEADRVGEGDGQLQGDGIREGQALGVKIAVRILEGHVDGRQVVEDPQGHALVNVGGLRDPQGQIVPPSRQLVIVDEREPALPSADLVAAHAERPQAPGDPLDLTPPGLEGPGIHESPVFLG